MKKTALILLFVFAGIAVASAQKFAMVDMEYIFKNVPAYEMANEQLNQLSQRWQKEVEAVGKEAETMYQNYLADKVFLTDEQIKKPSSAINTSGPKANSIRSVRPFSNRYRTTSTTQLRKLPKNAASRPYSTVHRHRTSFMPRHVSTFQMMCWPN